MIWTEPVRFEDTIRKMHADGFRRFVEVGPRRLLSSMVREALRGEEFVSVVSNTFHRPGLVQFQHALAQLAAMGVPVDPSPLFKGRRARELDFSYPLSIEVKADSVILSVGYNPAPVAEKGRHVHVIGDAAKVGNLRTVIWGAWDTCMKI